MKYAAKIRLPADTSHDLVHCFPKLLNSPRPLAMVTRCAWRLKENRKPRDESAEKKVTEKNLDSQKEVAQSARWVGVNVTEAERRHGDD